jgi:hypothetical protein
MIKDFRCAVAGCGNRRTKKGVGEWRSKCYRHHNEGKAKNPYHRFRERVRLSSVGRRRFPNLRCEECGVEGVCDRHRIDGSKGYRLGNVRILCQRCHFKEHGVAL